MSACHMFVKLAVKEGFEEKLPEGKASDKRDRCENTIFIQLINL